MLLDPERDDDRHVAARLRDEPIVWLGTVSAGRPRTVPVWFHWADPTITVFCDPSSHKVGDLRANPAVSVALDTAGHGTDVVLGHGEAQLLDLDAAGDELARFGAKYGPLLGGTPVEEWVTGFGQPVRITLTRLIAWQRSASGLNYRSVGTA